MYISLVRQKVFGDLVRRIRESKNLSLRDAEKLFKKSKLFSLTAQALGSIERGEFSTISLDTAILLHQAFGIPLSHLIDAYQGKDPDAPKDDKPANDELVPTPAEARMLKIFESAMAKMLNKE